MKTIEMGHMVHTIEQAGLCFDCERNVIGALLDLFGNAPEFAKYDWPSRDRYMREWGALR